MPQVDVYLINTLWKQYRFIQKRLATKMARGLKTTDREWSFLTLTNDLLANEIHASVDPDTGLLLGRDPYERIPWWDKDAGGKKPPGSGKIPRKIRTRKADRSKPKERWVTRGAEDEICTRYENSVWNVGEGPLPTTDTHPNCACERIPYRPRKSDPADLFK